MRSVGVLMLVRCLRILREINPEYSQIFIDSAIQDRIYEFKSMWEFRRLAQDMTMQMRTILSDRQNQTDWLITEVNDFIAQNYCGHVTLAEIADSVHVNRSYLSRIYKERTGKNVFDVINARRVEKAKELLQTTNMRVYEVALFVGFEDAAYFSRFSSAIPASARKNSSIAEEAYEKGAALLLAVLLCVLCGCAQPVRARQKTQITLINGWGDSSLDGDRIQELYARFNEENDDIQLNFLTLANTEAVVKVAEDMLVVGRQPDIISVGGGAAEQLYRYIVENGCALDLMPYLQSDPDFTEDAAPLVSSGWATEDGRLYNLSDSMLVSGYWYNVDMFAQVGYDAPPGTWHELVELCTALRLNYPAVTPLALDPSSGRALLDAMIAGGSAAGTQAVAAYTASGFDFRIPALSRGFRRSRRSAASPPGRCSATTTQTPSAPSTRAWRRS